MAINYDKLMAWPFADVRHRYTQRDTMLYALGIGLGADPRDAEHESELRFVYEKNLVALPTYPVVLADQGGEVEEAVVSDKAITGKFRPSETDTGTQKLAG